MWRTTVLINSSLKQKVHGVFLNYLHDFKAQSIGRQKAISLFSLQFFLFSSQFSNTRLKTLN